MTIQTAREPERAVAKTQTARKRFTVRGAEAMRRDLGVTPTSLAGVAQISPRTCQQILDGEPITRPPCERFIRGLRTLGHKEANDNMIEEVAA